MNYCVCVVQDSDDSIEILIDRLNENEIGIRLSTMSRLHVCGDFQSLALDFEFRHKDTPLVVGRNKDPDRDDCRERHGFTDEKPCEFLTEHLYRSVEEFHFPWNKLSMNCQEKYSMAKSRRTGEINRRQSGPMTYMIDTIRLIGWFYNQIFDVTTIQFSKDVRSSIIRSFPRDFLPLFSEKCWPLRSIKDQIIEQNLFGWDRWRWIGERVEVPSVYLPSQTSNSIFGRTTCSNRSVNERWSSIKSFYHWKLNFEACVYQSNRIAKHFRIVRY